MGGNGPETGAHPGSILYGIHITSRMRRRIHFNLSGVGRRIVARFENAITAGIKTTKGGSDVQDDMRLGTTQFGDAITKKAKAKKMSREIVDLQL